MQSTKRLILIGLKDSPVALCGHTDRPVLQCIISADASNSSFITSSTFYNSDQTLTACLTNLGKHASGNSVRRSIPPRGVISILADVVADDTDGECPPCGIASTFKPIVDIGSLFDGDDEGTAQPLQPDPDDPPPAQFSTCAVNSNQMPLDMKPPEAPGNGDRPCKMSCNDGKVSLGSHGDTNDGSFQAIVVDNVNYTGTVVFKFNGKGDKDYKLELVKEKDSTGGGVNVDECDFPDPNTGHEIDIDETLTGSYHAKRSGSFQFDFDIDIVAFQAQGNTVPTNPAATAFLNNFSGLDAEIDGSVKDITTLNGAQLAGYGISAMGIVEVL